MAKMKEWNFGMGQVKIWIEDQSLYWKLGAQNGSWKIDSISTITYETSILYTKIRIYTGGTIAKTLRVSKGKKYAAMAKDMIDTFETMKKTSLGGSSQVSAVDELKKLAELKEQRIITDAEFQAKKKILLGI